MFINSINQTSRIVSKPITKVAPQPKMIIGLTRDTFTKSSNNTSNPIAKANSPISFTGMGEGYWFNKTYKNLPYDKQSKICEEQERLQKMYGHSDTNHVTTMFSKNDFMPNSEYQIKALPDNIEHTVYLDKNINKIGEEKTTYYKENNKTYRITKAIDYRNNTTTKIRAEIPNDKGNPEITDEIRIVRDKNNKVIRKEMMTHSEVKGAYDHKYVYPDGTEQIISSARKIKTNGKEVINKDMTSLDGTRTQYHLEQDLNGNKKLTYKITDKKGNVLMDLNKSMERLSENKFRTTTGNKTYDVTLDKDKFTIQEKGKNAIVLPILDKSQNGDGIKLDGDKSKMADMLLRLPADQLIALHDTVKCMVEVNGEFESSYSPEEKRIKTKINDDNMFTTLHEMGHAIDYRNSKNYKRIASINNDKDLQKIFAKEKKSFEKAYPDAQRNHVGYFIKGANGNLAEVVAEVNALRDTYTNEMSIAKRNQYLQQFYPRTIAYINNKLENYTN